MSQVKTELPRWDFSTVFPGLDAPELAAGFQAVIDAIAGLVTFFDEHGRDRGGPHRGGRVLDVFTRPQQAITKSLIDEILPQELPASVLDHVRKLTRQLATTAPGHTGRLLRLSYSGDSAYQPILSQLIREFGVDMSILHGQVDEIQDETFGSLAVYASGEPMRVRGAVEHLRAGGVAVQEVTIEI